MSHRQAKRARQTARAERARRDQIAAKADAREQYLDSLSHRRKLAWAEFHIDEAENLIKAWIDDGGYRVFNEPDGQGGMRLMAEQVEPLPDELGLMIGDALQCLRNCLDNLAFALCKANSTVTMTPEQEGDVSFPISGKSSPVPVVVGDFRIKYMATAAQIDICNLCPDAGKRPANQDTLWLLNKTANRDKHREIATLAVAHGIQSMGIRDGYISHMTFHHQRLKPGDGPKPILEIGAGTHVNKDMSHAQQILFDKGIEVEDKEVIPTLRGFHDYIRDTVFQGLEQHL